MKRTTALVLSLLIFVLCSFTVFAENIFIIEDGEDEFVAVPQTTTTTQPAETTTAGVNFEDILNGDSISGYLDSFKEMFGDGIDSFMNGLDSWGDFGKTTEPETTTGLSGIDGGQYVPVTQASAMTTHLTDKNTQTPDTEKATGEEVYHEELPSVLIVNQGNDDSWGISGSTLTLLVFIAAVVILILVIVIVLIIMTRKTDFDSAVKNRSALPDVDRPDSLAHFIESDDDKVQDDDDNYSNITYWDDE